MKCPSHIRCQHRGYPSKDKRASPIVERDCATPQSEDLHHRLVDGARANTIVASGNTTRGGHAMSAIASLSREKCLDDEHGDVGAAADDDKKPTHRLARQEQCRARQQHNHG